MFEVVRRFKENGKYKAMIRYPCGHERVVWSTTLVRKNLCPICKPKRLTSTQQKIRDRTGVSIEKARSIPPRPSTKHIWDGEAWVRMGLVVSYRGLKLTQTQWAEVCGISRQRIHQVLTRYGNLYIYDDRITLYKESLHVS